MKVHKWLPVFLAMPRMISELRQRPDLGLLHSETWFSRTIIVIQYWRSLSQLLEYSKNPEASHLPAWKAFNQTIGANKSVGIWHETYVITAGNYENIYVNMPPFGLGLAGTLMSVTGGKETADDRLKLR